MGMCSHARNGILKARSSAAAARDSVGETRVADGGGGCGHKQRPTSWGEWELAQPRLMLPSGQQ